MSNRLGKMLFWVLNAFVLLFLAAAMSMPAFATTTAGGVSAAMIMLAPASTGGEQASGILVLCIAVVVFLWCSIWPTRFIWALTMVIRIPVLALLLLMGWSPLPKMASVVPKWRMKIPTDPERRP